MIDQKETEIEFTQYLRPNGWPVPILIDCEDPSILDKAKHLKKNGFKFTAEVLSTGVVSFTIEKDLPDGEAHVLAYRLCNNGPEVPGVVNDLITNAYSNFS